MGNNVANPTLESLTLALITVLFILVVNIFTKGFPQSISILLGLVIGTLIASGMGQIELYTCDPSASPSYSYRILFWSSNF